ncbi:hypothetical protein GDO78_017301 [Eleutherodactylus coqui]|uniref:Uncharacterized protein n=1 Tax=Eleutherodactylus coqui TaxID=57060 RepID=A0A8J6BLM4_ELECQ|nr:hypothetical protein GDO78_017301 [Eleutherodactylus coqui]
MYKVPDKTLIFNIETRRTSEPVSIIWRGEIHHEDPWYKWPCSAGQLTPQVFPRRADGFFPHIAQCKMQQISCNALSPQSPNPRTSRHSNHLLRLTDRRGTPYTT